MSTSTSLEPTSRMARPAAASIALAFLLGTAGSLLAQGTQADYDRADALGERARDKVFKSEVRPHWSADGDRFWYRNDLKDGAREFVLVDAVEGRRRPAFDHARLAA